MKAGFLFLCACGAALTLSGVWNADVFAAASRTAQTPLYDGERPLGAEARARDPLPRTPLDMRGAVERALRHNPGLGAQDAQSRSSEEGRKSARGAFGPRLGMSYGVSKQERRPATVQRPAEYGVYSWGVEVSQPVFQGFRLLATYQKAALQADSDKASVRQSELAMTEKVQTAFLNYLRAAENSLSEKEALER